MRPLQIKLNSSTPISSPRFLRLRLPRVCVAIVGSTPTEMITKAEAVIRENPFVEFRLDYLSNPALALSKIKLFLQHHTEATVLATCRRAANGGKFQGSLEAQMEILSKAAVAGCKLVDVEIESAEELQPVDFQKLSKHAGIILSTHDFKATKKLEETYAKMRSFSADFIKIVSTARSLYDNVVMMRFLEKNSDRQSMIGLCMGEQGTISRVLGVRAGSAFTFAAAQVGEETGPGQIAGKTLRETYRIGQVDAATKVYGVVGNPISHSMSPAMMNQAFRRENINAVYVALHAKSLEDFIACVREIPLHGASVTMPFKEEILAYMDNTDPVTAKIGACNTVVRSQDGKLYGFNTDVAGVVRPLDQRITIKDSKILVLGAGGAARAAVFGLKGRGADVYILNRTKEAGQKLARQAGAHSITRQQLGKLQFDVIVNATPVGMENVRPAFLLTEKELNTRYVFEMIYSPIETALVKMARAKGIHVIPGVEMFVHQGAQQFEIWTGKPAPVEEMHRVVVHALSILAKSTKA